VYGVLGRNLFVNQIALPKVSIRPVSDFTVALNLSCPSYIDKLNVSTLLAIACNKNSLFAIDKKGETPSPPSRHLQFKCCFDIWV
jgi:hypothetical protein